ncbi:hypothetical protein [Synechococcus sp. C9]|uniref:type II toxin-antitoxin system Phd/YefM family antitoxin n=1 Tax=Synechococcus sp. C9 TaxID=102119 RepID=UPI001FF33AC3|nr:hypothetical protein [Synechococcus sp. C9]
MAKTVSLNEAQNTLAELIHCLAPDEVVTITENERPVAQIIPWSLVQASPPRPRPPVTGIPKAGRYEGQFTVPDDFKEPLEDMRDYLEKTSIYYR